MGLGLTLVVTAAVLPLSTAAAVAPARAPLTATTTLPAAVLSDTPRTGSLDHPYSPPTWYPLREDATSSCVRTNCSNDGINPYHGYWAIDFLATKGDPVHATGHGILHVGNIEVECGTSTGSTKGRGTWLWIDHGGSVVSMYYHLDSITPGLDGQPVTPLTQIGTVGRSGTPCRPAQYLNYEVRTGGTQGKQIYMGDMRVCTANGEENWPTDLGLVEAETGDPVTNWDQLPARPGQPLPDATNDCIPTASPATPDRPAAPVVRHRKGTTTISWTTPGVPVRETMITREQFSTKTGEWRTITYHATSGDTVTFTDLELGKRYRFGVAHRNGAGWSAWSRPTLAVPADPASPPRSPVTSRTDRTILLDWDKPATNGSTITGYQVQRRAVARNGTRGPWSAPIAVPGTQYRWTGLKSGATSQVRARTLSSAGPSAWIRPITVTTLR
jgi:hypothetical protein